MFEPLVVGVYLPSLECQPWFIKGTDWVTKLEQKNRTAYKSDSDIIGLLDSLFETSVLIPTLVPEEF